MKAVRIRLRSQLPYETKRVNAPRSNFPKMFERCSGNGRALGMKFRAPHLERATRYSTPSK